ncbi:hypothetical protein NCCP28_41410 [Niallia sp. NCCP-28]|nr:hypothetical protein NCCP28_41410 [Niallia sp. NCCP-28]
MQGNEVDILISHRFMGTPQNVRYLGREFAEIGYTVYGPRLKGHGTHFKDMEQYRHKDWSAHIEENALIKAAYFLYESAKELLEQQHLVAYESK